jgi:hypothetical protein
MTRGDRDTAGQKLAPNEWATALKRLTNESGAVLTDCSAGTKHASAFERPRCVVPNFRKLLRERMGRNRTCATNLRVPACARLCRHATVRKARVMITFSLSFDSNDVQV